MDTSEQYIKMNDCPEIQGQRKPRVEKMPDGRWHKEWELETGDFIGVYSAYNLLEIEVKGSTIYDPYFYSQKEDSDIDISQVGFDEGGGYTATKIVWLPRQDQIQEMLIKEKFGDFDAYWNMCIDIPLQFVAKNPDLELCSMEQIWLSCYMLSIHQKVWSFKDKQWLKKQ